MRCAVRAAGGESYGFRYTAEMSAAGTLATDADLLAEVERALESCLDRHPLAPRRWAEPRVLRWFELQLDAAGFAVS